MEILSHALLAFLLVMFFLPFYESACDRFGNLSILFGWLLGFALYFSWKEIAGHVNLYAAIPATVLAVFCYNRYRTWVMMRSINEHQ